MCIHTELYGVSSTELVYTIEGISKPIPGEQASRLAMFLRADIIVLNIKSEKL